MTDTVLLVAIPPPHPLRVYFQNIAIWSVWAVPAGFGTFILTTGAMSFFVKETIENPEFVWPFVAIGVVAGAILLAPLLAVAIRGWRWARGFGKSRLGALAVACGGVLFAVFMSAVYLALAAGLTWLLFTKA